MVQVCQVMYQNGTGVSGGELCQLGNVKVGRLLKVTWAGVKYVTSVKHLESTIYIPGR